MRASCESEEAPIRAYVLLRKRSGSAWAMPGLFSAGHGMAAEEEFCGIVGKKLGGLFGDADFRAAGVCDQGVGGGQARDFREQIESGADG